MNVIDRIWTLKEEQNLTSREIEQKAGLANSSLSQWKKGKGKPSIDNLVKVAQFFQVSADWLLCLSDERCRTPDAAPSSCAEGGASPANSILESEISLTEEELILLDSYHKASVYDRFRIIQVCMNARDAGTDNKEPFQKSFKNA